MLILLSWLKDFVDIDISPKELEEKLFSTGFEVEGVKYLGEGIENVYVGKVRSIEKCEGTHLYICHIDCGEHGDDLEILTGADNVFEGALVPTCVVGGKLPGGIEIAPRKMQNIMSYGMLCSGAELGIDKDWYPGSDVNGIMILNDDAKVGQNIKDYLCLDDYIFDISVTANRPDCQSVLGIAREVAAFLGQNIKEPDMSFSCDEIINKDICVDVLDQDVCPRYLSRYIFDVKNVESPLWIKRRLIAVGHNVINAIVDITNYVMVEIGQPMHAFDLDTLEGDTIIVRRAKNGEKLVTLDEKERVLNENNLLICDKTKAIGLAGIMGGLNSEIKDSTNEVLFESAKFLKDNVRKTARGLGIQSDAASRFEKGIDEYTCECGMARALNLVQTLDIAKISSISFDISAGAPQDKRVISVPIEKISYVLGIEVPENTIVSILKNLSFDVELKDGVLKLAIPRYREDIETYQDIAEEIIREYGYDHVIPTFLGEAVVTNGGLNKAQNKELSFKQFLCTQGYYEIQTIAMTSQGEFDQFLIPEDSEVRRAVPLLNPITENLSIMRTIMAPSMVRIIESNLKNGNESLKFFELANVYIPKELPIATPPLEVKFLCMGTCGAEENFFTMKAAIDSIAASNGLEFSYQRSEVPYLHPGRTADIICNDEIIGWFGQLRYEIIDSLNISKDKKSDVRIFIAEINYDKLYTHFKREITYIPETPYTKLIRDISIVLDKGIACGEIIKTIKDVDPTIRKVDLFDVFESEKLGENKISMAFKLLISSADSDITGEDADSIIAKVSECLNKAYGAIQR